jgi:hypothetical protein
VLFCSEIQTKHINFLCWQNAELFNSKLGVTCSGYWVFNCKEWRTKSTYNSKQPLLCMISGFRLKTNEICALLGCYAAYGVNSLPTFRGDIGPIINCQESFEDGTKRLCRNVGKELIYSVNGNWVYTRWQ